MTRAVSVRRLPPVWALWLLMAAAMTALALPSILSFTTQDPDDYMRLLQVRDWLSGQGWYDTRQYRFDPPAGADMHWVRLVDLPIALAVLVGDFFLSQRGAETFAMVAVPLGQLLLTMYLMRAVMRAIGATPAQRLVAVAIIPAFPLLLTNFLPMRIDHHGWQALCALAMAWAMLKDSRKHALLAGLIGAALLTISLEGIALAAVFGGIFAARYWLDAKRQHDAYLAGLALGIAVLLAIFRPLGEFTRTLSDLPGWPHMLAFGGGALVAAVAQLLPAQDRALGRLLSLLPVAAVAGAALFVPLGMKVLSPLDLDPFLREQWFDKMAESAALPAQTLSIALMTLWTILIIVVGGMLAVRSARMAPQRRARMELAAVALGAGAISCLIMRAGLTAQIFAVPFAALMIATLWPSVRALGSAPVRIAATLALLALATPILASAVAKPFEGGAILADVEVPEATTGICPVDRLASLPPSHIFITIDRGPELLARTHHTAIMGGYHRNQAKMIQTIRAFSDPLESAEAIVRANRADYVAACMNSGDLWVAAKAGPDNLADRIIAGEPPVWLVPVAGFETTPLRLYRVQ